MNTLPPAELNATPLRPLRIWPAIALLILMGVTKFSPIFSEDFSFGLFMLTVFGPALASLGILLWWALASRATARERSLGFVALLAIIGGSYFLCHQSLREFAYMIYVLPVGCLAFTGTAIVMSKLKRPNCLPAALLAAVAGFGAWTLLRIDGIDGSFRGTFAFRFSPTAEELFLAERPAAKPTNAAEEPLGDVVWPQFRGAHRDSIVPGVVLDADWNKNQPKEIWRRKVGPGWSSFAAAGNRIFTQEQRGPVELVVCYDAATGKERWSNEVQDRFEETVAGAGPRATPTLHNGELFALGANGILQCLNPLTGESRWRRDLKQDADRIVPTWGFSSSPLIVGDVVLVHAGGKGDKGLLAYDIATGEPRWSAPSGDHSYSSPQTANIAGQDVVLMVTNLGVNAVDPATGKPIWDYDWKFEGYRVLQPLIVGDSDFLLGTGAGAGTRRIQVAANETDGRFKELWTSRDLKPDFNDYVLLRGYLYGFDHNMFTCIDLATGKRKWKERGYGNGQVLLLPDADQLLVLSETGELALLKASSEMHEELSRIPVLAGKTWNHPALVGNRIYVRNGEEAACFELPRKAQ